jgi:hypothetical protein
MGWSLRITVLKNVKCPHCKEKIKSCFYDVIDESKDLSKPYLLSNIISKFQSQNKIKPYLGKEVMTKKVLGQIKNAYLKREDGKDGGFKNANVIKEIEILQEKYDGKDNIYYGFEYGN